MKKLICLNLAIFTQYLCKLLFLDGNIFVFLWYNEPHRPSTRGYEQHISENLICGMLAWQIVRQCLFRCKTGFWSTLDPKNGKFCPKYFCTVIEITLPPDRLQSWPWWHLKDIGHRYLFYKKAKLYIRSVISARLD